MKSQLIYVTGLELFQLLSEKEDAFYAVIDSQTKTHLPEWVINSPQVYWVENPEKEKSVQYFEKVVSFFLDCQISRSSTLVAIGGGATTDLAGFVAATILRGIKWVSIPTTLLAMVDGSIGGKVAINMPQGKNLLGAFHNPEKIYLCYEFLATLAQREMESGKGEILKYGFLSKKINQLILTQAPMKDIIDECARFKLDIVEKDLTEKAERILLNLGHTLGHAFEVCLQIPHGLAVAMGIKYLMGLFSQTQALKDWEEMIKALGLPLEKMCLSYYPGFHVDKFKNYIKQDKKRSSQVICLVLIKEIGQCYTREVSLNYLISQIEAYEEFQH